MRPQDEAAGKRRRAGRDRWILARLRHSPVELNGQQNGDLVEVSALSQTTLSGGVSDAVSARQRMNRLPCLPETAAATRKAISR
jgi:hypothetical protein